MEITKEFELSSISWSDQKYEAAATAALERIPLLKSYLSKIEKDDRYRYEIVKRMITVKAKKQTELATKRKNRPSISGNKLAGSGQNVSQSLDVMSVDSGSQSPHDGAVPFSPNSSPMPMYTYEYRPSEQNIPKPFGVARVPLPLSPQSAQSQPADISDIFLAQTRRIISRCLHYLFAEYVTAVRAMQDSIRQRDGQIYALQSKVIELERQLDHYRRAEMQRTGAESPRKPYRRC